MSGNVTVKITGFRELGEALHGFGKKVEKQGLSATAYAGADVFRKAVKATTAFRDRTGNLRANMIVKSQKSKGPAEKTYRVTVRWARYRSTKENKLKGRVGKYLEHNPGLYARFLEYGTSRMHARPFMRPAFHSNVDRAIAAMRERLRAKVAELTR